VLNLRRQVGGLASCNSPVQLIAGLMIDVRPAYLRAIDCRNFTHDFPRLQSIAQDRLICRVIFQKNLFGRKMWLSVRRQAFFLISDNQNSPWVFKEAQ